MSIQSNTLTEKLSDYLNELSIDKSYFPAYFGAHLQLLDCEPLAGGCLNEVYKANLALSKDKTASIVLKYDPKQTGMLSLEAWMLEQLAQLSTIPTPKVFGVSNSLLAMSYCPASGSLTPMAQEDLAQHLAGLHRVQGPYYGLERDTMIGILPQPNSPTPDWIPFFRDNRLLYMANKALDEGALPQATHRRVLKLASELDRWLIEPDFPALLHGDLWHGNILINSDHQLSALIDPAIYYGHPEIELAFMTLFGSVDDHFFETYHALNPIEPDFFEVRRPLYNLYPLLVHVRLFGSSYASQIESTLKRFGY